MNSLCWFNLQINVFNNDSASTLYFGYTDVCVTEYYNFNFFSSIAGMIQTYCDVLRASVKDKSKEMYFNNL